MLDCEESIRTMIRYHPYLVTLALLRRHLLGPQPPPIPSPRAAWELRSTQGLSAVRSSDARPSEARAAQGGARTPTQAKLEWRAPRARAKRGGALAVQERRLGGAGSIPAAREGRLMCGGRRGWKGGGRVMAEGARVATVEERRKGFSDRHVDLCNGG